MTYSPSHPWERQHGESRQAFRAFGMYRDMDARTRRAAEVALQYGCHVSLIERWQQRWQWVKRAETHDAELDRRDREQEEEARAEERAIRLRIARRQQDVGEALLAQGDRQLAEAERERAEKGQAVPAFKRKVILRTVTGMVIEELPGAMERMELSGRLSERAEKTQRLERQLPTEYIEQTGTLRYEHEHKDVDDFRSDIENLDAQLDALGVSDDVSHELAAAIRRHDAAAETESQREEQPG